MLAVLSFRSAFLGLRLFKSRESEVLLWPDPRTRTRQPSSLISSVIEGSHRPLISQRPCNVHISSNHKVMRPIVCAAKFSSAPASGVARQIFQNEGDFTRISTTTDWAHSRVISTMYRSSSVCLFMPSSGRYNVYGRLFRFLIFCILDPHYSHSFVGRLLFRGMLKGCRLHPAYTLSHDPYCVAIEY